jgi:hypothetical protein
VRILRRRARPPAPRVVLPSVLPATVLVRPEVIESVRLACSGAGDHETGGPLVGTVQRSSEPGGERLIVGVLGTVSPGPGLRADPASVALGASADGERAASALRWWRKTTGLDLVHLGDWHLHPSGCSDPSGGDVFTAERMLRESAAPLWLTAIAARFEDRDEALETKAHVVRLSSEHRSTLELAFHREVGRTHLARTPMRVDGTALPRLPALPWHVADPVRFAVECRLLDAEGFKTAISADGGGRLELRLSRDGRAVTVTTGSGYPQEAPKLADDRRWRVRANGWSPDRFLVDLVKDAA